MTEIPTDKQTTQDTAFPDLGHGSLPCTGGGGSSRTIYESKKKRDVTIVVDPGECEAIVTLLPRRDARNDITIAGGPRTVTITGKKVLFI
jgi:hypothetical protein